MEFLKCLGLLGGSLMVFTIAGGSADLQRHRLLETRVDKTITKSELQQTGKVLVEMYTVIDDGVTKRTLKSQIVVDSIYDRDVENLNSALKNMTYNTIVARQHEIDTKSGSYRGNVFIDHTAEMTPIDGGGYND